MMLRDLPSIRFSEMSESVERVQAEYEHVKERGVGKHEHVTEAMHWGRLLLCITAP